MDPEEALDQLRQPTQLSILSLSEPILNTALLTPKSPSKRYSNADQITQTPDSLAADLKHYQELFSKLRFSYVEQVTKERFLRSVTADEPEFVSAAENAALEDKLKEDKNALKEKKEEVRGIIVALQEQGRNLARRYEQIQLRKMQLGDLPQTISNLEASIQALRLKEEPLSQDPEMCMSVGQTRDLLLTREQELQGVELEIERLQAVLPAKKAEVQRLRDEIGPIHARKIKAVEEAQEAKRRGAQGGKADELEAQGRWLKGVENSLKAMLEV